MREERSLIRFSQRLIREKSMTSSDSSREPFRPQVPPRNGHAAKSPQPLAVTPQKYKPPNKARQTAEMIMVMMLKVMEFNQDTYYSPSQLKNHFSSVLQCSEKTVKRYLDELHGQHKVTIKEQFQRLSPTRTTVRHLYKFCITPEEWRDKIASRKRSAARQNSHKNL